MLLKLARFFTSPRQAALLFAGAVFLIYGALPFAISREGVMGTEFGTLAVMGSLAAFLILAGFTVPLVDGQFSTIAPRLRISAAWFHAIVWSSFFLFVGYSFVTAGAIPIVSVFQGASADELSQQRGDLFKSRQGVEIVLLYLGAIFVSALLPLSLVKMYVTRSPFRHVLMAAFFFFTISSLHKAMFLNVALPLSFYSVRYSRCPRLAAAVIVGSGVALLFMLTVLASGRRTTFELERPPKMAWSEFFSATHVPLTAAELLVWRAVAVPVFTAADSLVVFEKELEGTHQLGATSSLLSALTGRARVPFERMVFAHQWGWNDIANSNAVFFIEAYVNFGWVGVVLFSLFVGQTLRWFCLSRDPSLQALWLVYCFALFSGGLIGMLLSNAYAVVLLVALLVRFGTRLSAQPSPASPTVSIS